MTARIFLRLLLTFMGLLAMAALGLDYLMTAAAERNLRQSLEASLAEKARLAAVIAEQAGEGQYANLADRIAGDAHARVTIIRNNGSVLADSEADAAAMENQASRPEFAAALANDVGISSRESTAQGAPSLYVAVPMRGGALRLTHPIPEIHAYTRNIRSNIVRSTLLALIPVALLAGWLARRISGQLSRMIGFSEELARGNFDVQAPRPFGGELGALQQSLRTTSLQLRSTFEQVQQERSRFEAAINGIGEGILVADRERRVILINPAMKKMFPKDPLKTGSQLTEWSHPQVQELFAEVFQTETVRSVELTVRQPAERSWKVTCAPIAGPSRKIHAAVAVFYDITEIERVDRMRKDFVINVSHELRTPLTAIQGYTETLLDGAMDEPEHNRRFLRIIRQNSERLAQLTSDLMVLSQIEVNAREFVFLPHKVVEVLIQSTDAIRVLTQPKNISVNIDPVDRHLAVDCDSDAIHQVLMNLLENAAKYTPEGGTITVGAQTEDNEVEFYVRDNGIGIPPEHIPRLFERFYRVDKARSRALGGTGLGLAIVKHLVLAHGGTVRVESIEGQGSTFYFRIPSRVTEPGPGRLESRQSAMLT
jgi:two-component system phosphate regulon sensor histidine kinase PhoR